MVSQLDVFIQGQQEKLVFCVVLFFWSFWFCTLGKDAASTHAGRAEWNLNTPSCNV